MFNEVSSTIALPGAQHAAAEHDGPLPWRLAIPLIGGASVGLWIIIGKAIALLMA